MMSELCNKPLVNMESAMNHPCQALADWHTMDELKVPERGKFVLSWVNHPRALPLAVPAATVHMAAMRGMEVVVLRPEGFALPPAVMQKAAAAAAASGGSLRETSERDDALAGAQIVYAGVGLHVPLWQRRGRCARARGAGRLVRARHLVRARRGRLQTHALPAGPA
jgi:N-acetylornithine carbamoyltransferase